MLSHHAQFDEFEDLLGAPVPAPVLDIPRVPLTFYKLRKVVELAGMSKTEIYRQIADKAFPAPRHGKGLGAYWPSTDIEDWQFYQLAGIPYVAR